MNVHQHSFKFMFLRLILIINLTLKQIEKLAKTEVNYYIKKKEKIPNQFPNSNDPSKL